MKKAPFRLRKPLLADSAVGGAPQGPTGPGDPWLARLVKLVPSEVIAVYLAGKDVTKTWAGGWALICLGLVFVARTLGTKESGKPVQWVTVVVSLISYVIWVYATGGQLWNWQLPPDKGIASAAVLLWTFLVPYFYKGD